MSLELKGRLPLSLTQERGMGGEGRYFRNSSRLGCTAFAAAVSAA